MRTNCPKSWQSSRLDSQYSLDSHAELWLSFGGACEPSGKGGRATFGFLIRTSEDGSVVVGEGSGIAAEGPGATNNVAEWFALQAGICWLAERRWRGTLHVRGDSQLVIRQLTGRYECRAPHLEVFHFACKSMLGGFKRWEAKWIRRKYNGQVHKLSKAA